MVPEKLSPCTPQNNKKGSLNKTANILQVFNIFIMGNNIRIVE